MEPFSGFERIGQVVQRNDASPRRDGWSNFLSKVGTNQDPRNAGEFQCVPVSNWEAEELWRGDDIARRVIEMRPRDAMKRGYEIKLDNKEQADDVQSLLEHIHANRKFVIGGQFQRAYGGSILWPLINDGQGDLAEELNEDAITVPKAIHVFEPRQLRPFEWDDDAQSPNFQQVKIWQLVPRVARSNPLMGVGMKLHWTRVIVFPGIRVSSERPVGTQDGFGDSVLTAMRDVLRDYNLSWGAAVILLQKMGQGIFKMHDLASAQAADRDDLIEKRIMGMSLAESVLNMMMIDKDDEFDRVPIPMTGMPEILQQFSVRLAAAADTTVTKMMGQSPAGLNATGESDITIDDDGVMAYQDEHMPQLERLVRICAILPKDGPLKGKEPKNWSCVYRPLRQPSEKEIADLRKVVADTDVVNINAEVYTADDAAKSHYGGDKFNPDITIDWKAREAQKKAMEQASAEALAMQQEVAAKASEGGADPEATNGPPVAEPASGIAAIKAKVAAAAAADDAA